MGARLGRIAILAVVAGVVGLASIASAPIAAAHPLGNFTVNVSAALVVRSAEVQIRYVVDMAEIPAFRERRMIDGDLDGDVEASERATYARAVCERYAGGLDVALDGAGVPLAALAEPILTLPPGAGGLPTLRLECSLTGSFAERPIADGARATIAFTDGNHPDAVGWREVTAAGDRVTIVQSDVPAVSASEMLRSYPAGQAPPDVRAARLTVEGGGAPLSGGGPRSAAQGSATGGDGGVLASLVGRADLTPGLVTLMILLALGVGAIHALGPGHGKTLIGAYLVGGGGTIRHAVGVGIAVSLMHTSSVLALGGVVLTAERLFAPERIYPWLGVASGVIAIVLGTALLRSRLRAVRADPRRASPDARAHDHHHRVGSGGLVALAFSGGALPSPAALLVLLGAVSIGRVALGLALLAAFSVGLAAALVGVGAVALRARDLASRRLSSRAARFVPLGSAAAILGMGLFLAGRSASQL